METFSEYLLVIASFYGAYKFLNYYMNHRDNFLLFTTISIFGVLLFAVFILLEEFISVFDVSTGAEWSKVLTSSTILTALAFLIRNSKPVFARFPSSFALLPLLLIPTYLLAINTVLLKEIVVSIYFGGAILIALMVFALKVRHHADFWFVIFGVLILTSALIIHWIPSTIAPVEHWVIYLLVALGIYIISKSYSELYTIAEYELGSDVY